MNRLRLEKSPYLQQHAENPVDWFPWGEEAFEQARKRDCPVFLSIGYATCHWCHVMERESFEDPEVARLMNDVFVNIKVDREERPDIDQTYMTVCQMMTGQGGWPLTILMTPDKVPFFAATYLPRDSRPQRIGMTDLIPQVEKVWREDRERVMRSAASIREGFERTLRMHDVEDDGVERDDAVVGDRGIVGDDAVVGAQGTEGSDKATDILKALPNACLTSLQDRFDPEFGSFGTAPKFPSAHQLWFLLRMQGDEDEDEVKDEVKDTAPAKGQPSPLQMVHKTLLGMRAGGLWDHVGGGFHRYSTDRQWLLPHFEKMLYDQATLMLAYAEGWQATGEPLFKSTANKIAEYLSECLCDPSGGFYSAEDADSEGEEGKFYVWSETELREHLTPEQFDRIADAFHINPKGNFRDEATGRETGLNILHRIGADAMEMADLSDAVDKSFVVDESAVEEDGLMGELTGLLSILKEARDARPRPLLDDKLLTDWNGLMMAALAVAGRIFEDSSMLSMAQSAGRFLRDFCVDGEGRLWHRVKDGEAAIQGMADDYAFVVWGFLELYEATGEPADLEMAVRVHRAFRRYFWDDGGRKDAGRGNGQRGGAAGNGYFFTPSDGEVLLGRQKEVYDGAIPSANSVAVLNAIRLWHLTGDSAYDEEAEAILRAFSGTMESAPAGYACALLGQRLRNMQHTEVIICSTEVATNAAKRMFDVLRGQDRYRCHIILKTPENAATLEELVPYSAQYPLEEGRTAAYVCTNFACSAPVYSAEELGELLRGLSS